MAEKEYSLVWDAKRGIFVPPQHIVDKFAKLAAAHAQEAPPDVVAPPVPIRCGIGLALSDCEFDLSIGEEAAALEVQRELVYQLVARFLALRSCDTYGLELRVRPPADFGRANAVCWGLKDANLV